MAGLDWFTEEAILRAREIYKSFHPEAQKDENEVNYCDEKKEEGSYPRFFP